MAVKANVRKRKHSQHSEEVTSKKVKKSKSPKKQKKIHDDNGEVDNDVAEENSVSNEEDVFEAPTTSEKAEAQDSGFEEKPMKFSSDFKMMNFRTKLRGTNFITELRHFLYLMERKTSIVSKYIEKRGKPLELAETLERINKSNVLHISYICHALQAVVMEIVSNQPVHMESAVSACRYLLKVHSGVIELLLESVQVKHRRIALKLLTAIVCVDPHMGRQILAAFNILSDVRKIDQHLSHSKFEQNEQETVRKCYIHFVLAFLVDGDSVLVQNILDRSALVQALVFGLLYDDHTTVCLVLKTLKKYVLENTNISKTKKVHVFDLECCKRLVRLYDWYGPNVYAAQFSGKHSKTSGNNEGILPKEKLESLINPDERESVSTAVHEFLITLLSSRKYGITFDATTRLRQKHNAIQGKIIGYVTRPWLCERKTELIIKILKACPELARHTVRHFAKNINPHRLGEVFWVRAANFLTDIISTLNPELLRNVFKQITLTDFSYWIKDVCLPLDTLVTLKVAKTLKHSNPECRLATHRLLLAMFTQYSNFMNAAMEREQAKGGSSTLRRFKFDIFNHILSHFPSVNHILNSLNLTVTSDCTSSEETILAHLHVTLDLILIICKQNRNFVNRTSAIVDYLKLIRPLYTGEESEDNEIRNVASRGDIKLELKAIKTILLLSPNALQPDRELFSSVLKSFIKCYVYGVGDVQREAGELLRDMFKNTGIFESSVLEIDLWLEALRFSDSDTVEVVTQVFMVVLKVTQADVDLPADIDIETNEANLNRLFGNIEKGLSVETYVESFAISKLLPLIFKGVDIVEPLNKYIDLVCILLFHYHPKPAYISKLYEMKFESSMEYINNWLNRSTKTLKSKNSDLPNVCEQIPFLMALHNALLRGKDNMNIEDIFGSSDTDDNLVFELEIKQKKYKFQETLKNGRLLSIYIQQTMFLIAQLMEKQLLTRQLVNNAADCIIIFLKIIHEIEEKTKLNDIIYTDDGNPIILQSFLNNILTYIYDIRLGGISSTELCNVENENIAHYLHFISVITEFCTELPDISNHLNNFRLKIVKAVAIGLESEKSTKLQINAEFIEMVNAFQLNVENCVELLDSLCKNLKYSDFFLHRNDCFERTFYYELLICTMRRLTDLQQAIKCEHILKPLTKFYINFVKKLSNELNLDDFEKVFHDFLEIMPQYIPVLDTKLFTCIIATRKISKDNINLACLLLERNDELNEEFIRLLPDNISKRELIYPLLEIIFKKSINLDTQLLNNIYQEYRNGFMKTIEKPQKAGAIYKDHAVCSITLVNACMPITESVDFCKKRFQFNDASEIYQVRLINAIYEKALKSLHTETDYKSPEYNKIFLNFLNLQVQLLSADLKRQTLNLEKLELYAYQIFRWFEQNQNQQRQHSEAEDMDFEIITKSQNWLNFCKICLKSGMQITETVENNEKEQALLLKLMTYLCDKLYSDFECSESKETIEPAEPAQLFQMICTHSKYYDIVLSIKPTPLKAAVLCLLLTLAKKSPNLSLAELEIPVILGAYHAKLHDSDRYALALLQLYELHNPRGLQQYRPFIWGESAISFYALHSTDLNERTRLTQQETTINWVMSLIDFQSCAYTIDNYPIWRKLNSFKQLPTIEFNEPTKNLYYDLGSNNLERHIELHWSSSISKTAALMLPNSIDLRLCPKADDVFLECYDPAFFLPLMSSCFAPETYVHAARPVENGLLAMCFAALSSQDKEMRQAAGLVQLRYRTHFEQSKFYERPLWIQAYENIQAGLAELCETWKSKHKNHTKDYTPIPRVPYIPTLFIARTFNITNDPTDLLYKQLTMYLRLKNTFNFQCIPEFNIFFHSPEVEHHTFRNFIIDIIRKGIKGSSDLFLLVSTNTFKVILGFYGNAVATLETNLLILSALSTCVKIPASAKIMVEHVGILPWLETVISTLEFYHFDIIEGIISILNNLWYAIVATRGEFYNYNYVILKIYHLVLSLLPLLSSRISVIRFAKLMNIMQKSAEIVMGTINASQPYASVSDDQLDKLIACAEKHFSTNVQYLKNLRTLGDAGAGSHEDFCAKLHSQSSNEGILLALSSLRAFIIRWWQNRVTNSSQPSENI